MHFKGELRTYATTVEKAKVVDGFYKHKHKTAAMKTQNPSAPCAGKARSMLNPIASLHYVPSEKTLWYNLPLTTVSTCVALLCHRLCGCGTKMLQDPPTNTKFFFVVGGSE